MEVRYRPIVEEADDTERDQLQAIFDAVDQLSQESPGDILIFTQRRAGNSRYRRCAEQAKSASYRNLAALCAAFEQRTSGVFQSHSGRRIVLATNVAVNLADPTGIKYVIDPGTTARISRYSYRTKVQRLPIEPISQASANQRKGRCGRVSEGICIRLYSEDDFLSRPAVYRSGDSAYQPGLGYFADDRAGLGDIAAFPFVEAPDKRNIQDGVCSKSWARSPTHEQASAYKLTPLGRQLCSRLSAPTSGVWCWKRKNMAA